MAKLALRVNGGIREVRKGCEKNKKSNQPATAIAVKHDETVRRAARIAPNPDAKA